MYQVCVRRFRPTQILRFTVSLSVCVFLVWIYSSQDRSPLEDHGDTKYRLNGHGHPRQFKGKLTHSTTTRKIDLEELLESMNGRRQIVNNVCKDETIKYKSQELQNHTLVSRMHHFIYCPVEKTASTFWRRFLYQLEYTSPMKSPYDVSAQQAYDGMTSRVKISEKGKRLEALLRLSTKVVFVRDPYARLYSAYVDKLLAPNPVFWELWGAPAVQRYRQVAAATTTTHSPGAKTCGSDVTFPEFIHLVTDQEWRTEPHVMPISTMCDPCRYNYTVIGKLETFARDTGLVLAYLGVNETQLGLDKMDGDVFHDAVRDSVTDAMSRDWLNVTLGCVSKVEVARRIWRKLQLRGFISWRLNFNLQPSYVSAMQASHYIGVLKEAARESMEFEDLGFQKKQGLLETFRSLKLWQFDEIRRVFLADFLMFGYNSSQFLDRLQNVRTTGSLDWWKDWDLSSIVPND